MNCGSNTSLIGKEVENRFMAVVSNVGWEPNYFKNPSGKFDILVRINSVWYKIQVKKSCGHIHKFHNWCLEWDTDLKKRVERSYKRNEIDFFGIDVNGDFYLLPYDAVYRKTGGNKANINIKKDAKYKLSNILKSYKNGKYYVGDEIIF